MVVFVLSEEEYSVSVSAYFGSVVRLLKNSAIWRALGTTRYPRLFAFGRRVSLEKTTFLSCFPVDKKPYLASIYLPENSCLPPRNAADADTLTAIMDYRSMRHAEKIFLAGSLE